MIFRKISPASQGKDLEKDFWGYKGIAGSRVETFASEKGPVRIKRDSYLHDVKSGGTSARVLERLDLPNLLLYLLLVGRLLVSCRDDIKHH